MAFSEALKTRIRKQAHLCCCVCRQLDVEIHHIVPEAEGGANEEDNAAPLCPSCHSTYGANPQKRKFIREARGVWYEICAAQKNPIGDQLESIKKMVQTLATKGDVERLAVQNNGFILGNPSCQTSSAQSPYAFERDEFINPLIVRELLGWLADPVATVVTIDLTCSHQSNQFINDFSQSFREGRTWINWAGEKGEWFAYAHMATSPSGIHMVECYDCAGGSGVFGSVGLFSMESDQALSIAGEVSTRPRILLKTLGSVPLGDRYKGKIIYQDGVLAIGADVGWFKLGEKAAKALAVR